MAWDNLGDGLYGGDEPLDAWGEAADRVSEQVENATGRKPSLSEVLDAARWAWRSAGFDPDASASFAELQRAAALPDRPCRRPPKLLTGEIVAIPYEGDRAVVGLVLFGDDLKKAYSRPGLGPCVAVFDLEAPDLLDPDQLRGVPLLIPPFHPGSSGAWTRIGRVRITPDPDVLPLFAAGEAPGGTSRTFIEPYPPGYARVVRDYFGERVPPAEEADRRVVPPSVGGFYRELARIRHRRGLCRDLPWQPMTVPSAGPPLARWDALQPFLSQRSKKKAPRLMTDDLRMTIQVAFANAVRACVGAWQTRWDRSPHPEELGYALSVVLGADPERYLCDPGRLPDRSGSGGSAPVGPWTLTFERPNHGVDLCRVDGPSGWRAWVEERDGAVFVDTTGGPERDVIRPFVVDVLVPAWHDWRGGEPSARMELILRGMERGLPERITL